MRSVFRKVCGIFYTGCTDQPRNRATPSAVTRAIFSTKAAVFSPDLHCERECFSSLFLRKV